MSFRIPSTLSYLSVALALAISCSSDEKKATADAPEAGAFGEGPTSGGSTHLPQGGTSGAALGGSGGTGKSGSSNAGGSGPTTNGGSASGSGGDGDGEPPGGAPSGNAGEPNEPSGPVSACGAGNYDSGEAGCMTCPAPSSAKAVGCNDFASAERDGDGYLLLRLSGLSLHEPFGGEVNVDWAESGAPGSATVAWEYSLDAKLFTFHLPVEARYADEITLASWTFTDACGFSFSAGALRVYWDGVESWQCGQSP